MHEPASRRHYSDWHAGLTTRRQFLLTTAGGLAALFLPMSARAGVDNPWPILAAVQDHLFPSEPDAPGAREIRALTYLQGVVADPQGDRDEQDFLLKGVDWLEDLARTRHKTSFESLDPLRREALLRVVAGSEKGEVWLSNLLYYICEALLADPIYGGNPDGIGWHWLRHTPGFPQPTKLPSLFGQRAGGRKA